MDRSTTGADVPEAPDDVSRTEVVRWRERSFAGSAQCSSSLWRASAFVRCGRAPLGLAMCVTIDDPHRRRRRLWYHLSSVAQWVWAPGAVPG